MMASTATTKPALQWGVEALWQQLAPLLPGLGVEVVASASSTNTALLDRARVVQGSEVDGGNVVIRRSLESAAFGRRAVDVQPSLLVAEHQTGGRGRQGRNWQSQVGASLTFSLGLSLEVSDWSGLSLAVGVALAEAIGSESAAPSVPALGGPAQWEVVPAAPPVTRAAKPAAGGSGLRIGLKWPNDLWLTEGDVRTGRKLGGVLIETVAAGAKRLVVVGVGLNVLPFRTDDLASGFACARELDPDVTAPALLAKVASPLVRALLQFEAEGFAAFSDRFDRLDLLRGQALRTAQTPSIHGTGAGVSAHGALLLQTDDGLRSISSGEVSVRLRDDVRTASAPGAAC